MSRSRNIKPAIMDNEALAALSPVARLLFIYLWMLADKAGRLEDRPARIKKQALGYDNVDADELLQGLEKAGFILRYEACGERLIQIVNFAKHQAPHVREQDSILPGPDQSTAKVVTRHDLGSDKASPRSPDSGFLIPDSGLSDSGSLIPDTPHTPHAQDADPPADVAPVATQAGAVCVCLRSLGIQGVHPHRPELVELLVKGATVGNFEDAATTAKESGKPTFAYVAGIVRRRMLDAATIAGQAMSGAQRTDKRGGQQAITQTVTNADQAKRLIGLNP